MTYLEAHRRALFQVVNLNGNFAAIKHKRGEGSGETWRWGLTRLRIVPTQERIMGSIGGWLSRQIDS